MGKKLKMVWIKSKSKRRNLILSVVALIEVLMITCVSAFAWTETTSSLQIIGNGDIDTFTYTTANVGSGTSYNNKPIDLSQFVRKSGNLHFSLASSANGTDFYFPKVVSMGSTAANFRKGNINDKNANYLEFSFDVKSVGAAKDFMFASAPTIKVGGATKTDNSVRIAISDGTTTRIYSNTTVNESVVAATGGATATASLNAFSNYLSTGKNSLFSVAKDATKRITVKIWLQYNTTKNANYTGQEISITNFKIVPVTPVSTDSTVKVSCSSTMGTVIAQSGSKSGTNISVAANSSVTIKATAKEGYQFVAWHQGTSASGTKVNGAGESYTFTAGASQTYNYYAEFAAVTTKRIYFVNNDGWSKVNCYAWNSSGNNGAWPGVAMTDSGKTNKDNKKIYYIDLPISKNYKEIIFNNGSSQTGNLTIPTDGKDLYDKKDNTWKNYSEYMEEQNVTNTTRRIYFTNNWNWSSSSVYCYSFKDANNINGSWPGTKMTFVKNNGFGQGIFYVDIPIQYTWVIFNNNSDSQTSDTQLHATNDGYYIDDSGNVQSYDYTG